MLLVSNFHDYYDTAFGFGGVDKTTVYTRHRKVTEHKFDRNTNIRTITDNAWFNPVGERWWGSQYHATKYVKSGSLWVCGKEYPIHSFINHDDISEIDYYYAGIDDDTIEDRYENYVDPRYRARGNRHIKRWSNPFRNYMKWISNYSQNQRVSDDINILYDSPVVLIGQVANDQYYRTHGYEVIVNPCLKDIGFTRVMGAYELFQEINMYLNGALCKNPEVEPEPLDEKTKLLKHGMDSRSFKH